MLRVSARQAGNQILIEVADDGRGIDGDALVRKARARRPAHRRAGRQADAPRRRPLWSSRPASPPPARSPPFPAAASAWTWCAPISSGSAASSTSTARPRPGRPALHPRAADAHHHPGADRQRRRPGLRHPALGDRRDLARRRRRGPHRPRSARPRSRRSATAACRWSASPTCSASKPRAARDEQKLILLKPAGGDVYALAVDAVHDHEELVVKPAAPAVMAAGLYAGTTLADDGRPILLLDPSGMAKCAGIRFDESELERALRSRRSAEAEAARETSLLLFRTLDGAPPRRPGRAGRADRGRRRRGDPASAPASCGSRSASRSCRSPAARPRRRAASCASCASPTAPARSPMASPRSSTSARSSLELQPAPAPGRGRRRRPDRRRPGRAARSLLAVRRSLPRRRGRAPPSPSARCPRAIPGWTICCAR